MPASKPKARIVSATPNGQTFSTSTKNTGMSQRETLEAIMLNLADHLGIDEILKKTSARGSDFYCPNTDGAALYQSATNTILEMSQMVLKR